MTYGDNKKAITEFIFWFIAISMVRLVILLLILTVTNIKPPAYSNSILFRAFEGTFLQAIIITLLNRLLQPFLKRIEWLLCLLKSFNIQTDTLPKNGLLWQPFLFSYIGCQIPHEKTGRIYYSFISLVLCRYFISISDCNNILDSHWHPKQFAFAGKPLK